VRSVSLPSDIKCPTKYVKVDATNDEEIKKELADIVYDCWDQFGQGKLELLVMTGFTALFALLLKSLAPRKILRARKLPS